MSRILLWSLLLVIGFVSADQAIAEPELKKLILPGEAFAVDDRPAFILWPEEAKRQQPQPWVFYSATLPNYPDGHESWMHQQFLDAGVAVAGIDSGEAYGSPRAMRHMTKLYGHLVDTRGFAAKPCLLGRSRGGLWVSNWAIENPGRVAGIAGIYSVFDLRSYPGLKKAAKAYELTPAELEERLDQHNPIARADVLAKAKVPVFIVHGDSDKVVPLEQNGAKLAEVYQQADATEHFTLLTIPGQGHNYWPGFFRCQELIDFAIARATAKPAAEADEPESSESLDGAEDAEDAKTDPSSATLWLYDPGKMSRAETTLAASLQGTLAKRGILLWRTGAAGMNKLLLDNMQTAGATIHPSQSIWQLVAEHKSNVDGYILFDLDTPSINVATSLCGPKNALLIDASLETQAKQAGLKLLFDARGMDELSIYEQNAKLFSSDIAISLDKNIHSHLRDWAIYQNAFCFHNVGEEKRLELLKRIGPHPVVYGWADEHGFVRDVSRAGGMVVPADFSINLSVLSQLESAIPSPPRVYPQPVKKGERIVAFVMTDGDNLQVMGGGFITNKNYWASPHRGTFPMTWEMPPIMARVAPLALRQFYSSATANDGFVSGPSGAGYTFPHYHSNRQRFAQQTGVSLTQSNLTVASVINADGTMDEIDELLDRPEMMGLLYKGWVYDSERGRIRWRNGKPAVSYRHVLWDGKPERSPSGVAQAIAKLPADAENNQDSYALVNAHAWSFRDTGGPMQAIKQCIDQLPENTRIVTAEQMVVLLRNNFGTPVDADEYVRQTN